MKKIMTLTIICFFTVTGVCFSQMERRHGQDGIKIPPGKWWRMPKIAQAINITLDEKEALDDIFLKSRRKMIDLKGVLEKELLELGVLLEKKDFNKDFCLERFKEAQKARTNLAMERFSYFLEIRRVLGQDRFQELKEKHRSFRKMAKEKGMKGKRGKNPSWRDERPSTE